MILNPERKIKINLNGTEIPAEFILNESDLVLKYDTIEKPNRVKRNILIITRDDINEN